MKIELKQGERIDNLQLNGLKIIQNKNGFCFGIDAVLLSDFAKNIRYNSKVLDLGTGTGIISILLCAKTKIKKIFGVEIQSDVCDMAKRSIELNNLQDKIEIINENILEIENIFKNGSFDAIVTNPPYKKKNTGIVNEEERKLISRHEILADLEDFIRISSKMLKDTGEFYMVHRPDRIVDIFYLMREYKIEPKEVRIVYSNKNTSPKMVLIKGIKNGKPFLKFRENLYIYDENGRYTEEITKIYNNKKEA